MATPSTQAAENQLPYVKYNGGYYSALPIQTTSDITGAAGSFTTLAMTTAPTTTYGTIYPVVAPNGTVSAQAATATLVVGDMNKNLTNTGASGTIVLTLPAVASCTGMVMRVQLTVAQIVQLLPVAGTAIALGGSAVVTKYLNIAGVIGHYVDIYCTGAVWLVTGYSGVVTKEA